MGVGTNAEQTTHTHRQQQQLLLPTHGAHVLLLRLASS
jgi:hypothetical protein